MPSFGLTPILESYQESGTLNWEQKEHEVEGIAAVQFMHRSFGYYVEKQGKWHPSFHLLPCECGRRLHFEGKGEFSPLITPCLPQRKLRVSQW